MTNREADRSHESVINEALARVMHERLGLDAVGETLREGVRPDIVVRLEGRVVVIETELEPASLVVRRRQYVRTRLLLSSCSIGADWSYYDVGNSEIGQQ